MVEFCSNCGAIIIGKKGEEVKCKSCGATQKSNSEMSLGTKVEKKKEDIVDKEVISTDTVTQTNPITEVECPECGHNKAHYWTKQTRAGDEPETQFFQCEKCKHQWRDYR